MYNGARVVPRKDEIPFTCAMNFSIINELIRNDNGQFKDACIRVPRDTHKVGGLSEHKPWPFRNASWIAYALYCMIVVPNEIYNDQEELCLCNKLEEKKAFSLFKIEGERCADRGVQCHFKSLRNAIAHVNYEFTENGVRFRNFPSSKDKSVANWEASICQKDLWKFLGYLAEETVNIYKKRKSNEASV